MTTTLDGKIKARWQVQVETYVSPTGARSKTLI
jgi:hypothetical protein